MSRYRKVIVIGLDGLEPRIVDALVAAGELPNLARLAGRGRVARVATTCPAQTPVAWSTFATGTNPGGHGVFDFLRRDPETYLPENGLNRHEHRNALLPPRVVNLRRGTPVWDRLSAAGIGSTVLRCPCSYPPDPVRGRMLSGMGVPDVRGGFGTPTFFTEDEADRAGEGEHLVRVRAEGGLVETHLIGPRHPRTRLDAHSEIRLELAPAERRLTVRSGGSPGALEVRQGEWSGWLRVKFRLGAFRAVRGMVRFYLARVEPGLRLYASPVNFDPDAPMFPIATPPEYARELAEDVGTYSTAGMVEDHQGLSNGRFDEDAFLAQSEIAWRERTAMMTRELGRLDDGLFFCLFDTPDRVQHMLWRFREPGHPANRGRPPAPGLAGEIEAQYRRGDEVVGLASEFVDDETLLIVLSDHGFGSFRRGFHLNAWLRDQGLLTLLPGAEPGDLLRGVDWERTRAYGLGLSGLYLNLRGREARGIVPAEEAGPLQAAIARGLDGLEDPEQGAVAVRRAVPREQVYRGPFAAEAPDLLIHCGDGYRISWGSSMGGVPAGGPFEDNTRKWSGDHIVDPALVPGVLLMNRPFRAEGPRLVDLAPTLLDALGVPPAPEHEGSSLLP